MFIGGTAIGPAVLALGPNLLGSFAPILWICTPIPLVLAVAAFVAWGMEWLRSPHGGVLETLRTRKTVNLPPGVPVHFSSLGFLFVYEAAMRTLDDIRSQLQVELPTLREHYNVNRIGICGSYVRGEQTEESDLDLLVTFTETPGLIEFVGLEHYLEDALGLSVDLGTPGGLKEGAAVENIRREVEYL